MSQSVKAAVLGAGGRMGTAIVRLLCRGAVEGVRLTGAMDVRPDVVGRDAGVVAGGGEAGVVITADFEEACGPADVLIDFSSPEATAEHARCARTGKKPMVIGTTGLNAEQRSEVGKLAEAAPVVFSPNMSLGVNLLFRLAAEVAEILKDKGYDIEIVEAHHRRKKDAPSGTALKLAEEITRALGWQGEEVYCFGREGKVGERPSRQIGIHAVRGGDIVGEHTVYFASEGELISLYHRATSRDAFAMGAIRAALWVVERPPGLYGMSDVLGLG